MGCRRLLFDTNALLDIVGSEELRPRRRSVADLVTRCFAGNVQTLLPVESLKDAYYIVRKATGSEETARACVRLGMAIFDLVDLRADHAQAALVSDEPDFEDGVIRAQAEELQVDAIVTDDRAAFASCEIAHMSAASCLAAFWPENVQ